MGHAYLSITDVHRALQVAPWLWCEAVPHAWPHTSLHLVPQSHANTRRDQPHTPAWRPWSLQAVAADATGAPVTCDPSGRSSEMQHGRPRAGGQDGGRSLRRQVGLKGCTTGRVFIKALAFLASPLMCILFAGKRTQYNSLCKARFSAALAFKLR